MFGFGKVFGVAKDVKAMPFALTPAWALPKREVVTLMETCVCCGEDYAKADCMFVKGSEHNIENGWAEGWYYIVCLDVRAFTPKTR